MIKILTIFKTSKAEGKIEDLKYFLDFGQIDLFLKEDKFLIIGKKGTGKTFLTKKITELIMSSGGLVKRNTISKFYLFLKKIDSQVIDKSELELTWRFLIFIEIFRLLSEIDNLKNDPTMVEINSFLNRNEILLSLSSEKIIQRIINKEIEVEAEPKISNFFNFFKVRKKKGTTENTVKGKYYEYIESFEEKINDILSRCNCDIVVIFDELDHKFEDTNQNKDIILTLIEEVKHLNEYFENFRCIISLRSEIFGLLNSSEINKVRSDYTIELSWDQQKLISALKLRLGKQDMNNQKFKKWLFKQKYKEINQNRVDIYRYLFYKTRFRPRDIFMFVKEIATISTKIPISIETIDLASGKYSNYFKNEMVNELHGFIPDEDIKTFIVELSEFQKTVFRIEDFKKYSSLTPKNILKIFQFLYDSDFVNLKVVQNSHRTKMIPCSQSSTTNTIKLSSEIAINYGLRDALNLYNN